MYTRHFQSPLHDHHTEPFLSFLHRPLFMDASSGITKYDTPIFNVPKALQLICIYTFLLHTLRPFCVMTKWSSFLLDLSFIYICFDVWDSITKRRGYCYLWPVSQRHIYEHAPNKELNFQSNMSWSFCVQWFEVIVPFVDIGRLFNYSNTTAITSGTWTAYPSGAHGFTPGF